MTRLRRAWAWVSGDQGPMYDAQRREGQARIAHHLAMAEQANALAEQDRTIQALTSISRHMQAEQDLTQRSGERWRREARRWKDERNEARDERDRARATAVSLEQDCARLTQQVAAENARMARGRAALVRARSELEVERANARALTRLLGHTQEHESRCATCPECHRVEAVLAAAEVEPERAS